MAVRWAVTGGTWSSTSTWNDGATLGIPTVGDDVYTNGFTVNVDTNANVQSLNNSVLTVTNTRLNPLMTSNTTPSGVVTASSGGSTAWNAFDGNTSSDWLALATPSQWIQYQFTSPVIVRSYSIFYRGGIAGYPTNFNLQGSNDGSSFVTLDTRTGYVYTTGQYNTLTITNPITAYSYYRLNITAVNSGNVQLPELTLNEAGITTTVGGVFNFNTNNITVSATSLGVGASNLITVTATGGTVALITTSNLTSSLTPFLHTGNCNFTLNGINFTCGAGNTLISKSSSGTITINGNLISVFGVNNTTSSIPLASTNGNTIVNGNVFGGVVTNSGTNNVGVSQTSGNLTINGNVYGGGGVSNTNYGVNFSSSGTISINGNVFGGAVAAGILTTGSISMTGSVYASSAVGISTSSAITIRVVGDVSASTTSNAIQSTNASGVVSLAGNMYNVNGKQAIYCQNLLVDSGVTTQARFFTFGGQDRTLYSLDNFPNTPSTSNVRNGVVYGVASGLTGTMIVPNPSDVRVGVPTDNTVGTATFTPNDFFNAITGSSNPVAVRLNNVSTVETTGDQLASYL